MNETLAEITTRYHRDLDELLWGHQEALLLRDLPLARGYFSLFRAAMEAHLEAENRLLLPLAESLELKGQWPISLYRHEHEKIRQLLGRVADQLAVLPEQGRQARRALLSLLEYQRTVKNVIEHHEQREEKGLLPELDGVLSDARRQQAVAGCAALWQALAEAQAGERQALDARLAARE